MEDLVSGNIEERILWTLRYFNSDDRYDTMSWILLDEIPQILEEHGLKYTQEMCIRDRFPGCADSVKRPD